MTARSWMPMFAAALAGVLAGAAQVGPVGERLADLAEVLGQAADATPEAKLAAIAEIGSLRTVSALASGLLFDRANARFEADPRVREAAAGTLLHVLAPRNRMAALRLVRIASPQEEPEPRVRMAALRTLAALEVSEAAAAVLDAASGAAEADPEVRTVARDLVKRGLAGSAL